MKKLLVTFAALIATGLICIFLLYSTNLSYYWCSLFFDYWENSKDRNQLERRMLFFDDCKAYGLITNNEEWHGETKLYRYDYTIFGKEVIEVYAKEDDTIDRIIPTFE